MPAGLGAFGIKKRHFLPLPGWCCKPRARAALWYSFIVAVQASLGFNLRKFCRFAFRTKVEVLRDSTILLGLPQKRFRTRWAYAEPLASLPWQCRAGGSVRSYR